METKISETRVVNKFSSAATFGYFGEVLVVGLVWLVASTPVGGGELCAALQEDDLRAKGYRLKAAFQLLKWSLEHSWGYYDLG